MGLIGEENINLAIKYQVSWNNLWIVLRLWNGFCNLWRENEIQHLIISHLKPYFISTKQLYGAVQQQEKCNPTTNAGAIMFTQCEQTRAITLRRRHRLQRKQTSIQLDTNVIITGAVWVPLCSLYLVFLFIFWQESLCQQHRYVQRCEIQD